MNRQIKTDMNDEKKEAAKLRMRELRQRRKENETAEQREARLKKQREQRAALRLKQNPNPRKKNPPKKIQDYKVNPTDSQNLDRIFKIQRDLNLSDDDIEFEILLDPDIIMSHIDYTYTNPNTKRSYYASLIKVLTDLGPDDEASKKVIELYREQMNELKDNVETELKKNLKNEKESERWLNWNEIKKVNASKIENPIEQILFLFYTEIPPRRTEYRTLKLIGMNDKNKYKNDNYIVLTPAGNITRIVLNDYKTHSTYGQYNINLLESPLLKKVLQKYIKDNEIQKGDYIFPPSVRHESGYSLLVKETFINATGKPLNINMLRKIYVSHINELPANERTQNKLQNIAQAMGTSIEQLNKNYTKVDDDDEDE